ncbi:tectonin beta-propeller repeat-containing protein 2-like [Penaeus japonicus]|uniref:tectonin beta-propeller repeat-containing protein 2-like n=1 Tax=Penaeus japonicus TaxID=27405 RepID=UPI001C7151D3|nr:tectonin beta-propeller repeat-containing protein 2-like [Penaeus japonicus]XP_042873462.1 tectonin beta-propeller repeat-containing protein 2-like [Penaeus japonicus]
MASGGSPEWKEWIPLTPLLDQLPQQFQRGLATSDLQLTCLASLPQHLVLGTNVGLVYLAHLPSLNLMRLKCENPLSPISSVSGVSTVDDMIAAGALDGTITIFQLPRVANVQGANPPNAGVLGSRGMSPIQPSVKRFTVGSIHSSRVTSLTWSRNGMRLFSGDAQGVVSVIDINYQTNECTARELLKEESSITQLSYSYQQLAVSTLERALIYNVAQGSVQQVGMKPRKHPGLFGCVWSPTISSVDAVLYTSRPGLRLWSANGQGEVMHTHIIKELPDVAQMQLLNPSLEKPREGERFSFGILFTLGTSHIVTYNPNWLFVIDINNLKVSSYSGQFRHISGVAVSEKEIFVLEGSRNISCISIEKPNIGEKKKPLHPKPSLFPDTQNLLGIKSKIMTQGSGFLDHIARMSSTVAAKVQEHATPTIVTGQNGKCPASQNHNNPEADPVQQGSHKAQQHSLSSSSLNIGLSRQELGHQRSSSSGTIQEPPQRSYSPSLIPPRMVQSVSSFFPSIISSQSLVKTFGKTPPLTDVHVPGEREVIGDLEEIVTSSQIVAQEGADAEPLVMRDKSKKKNKRRYDATPSPDTMSINSYRSTQSDFSDATSSELPSSPSVALSHSSISPSHGAMPQDLSTTLTESGKLQALEDTGEEKEVDGGSGGSRDSKGHGQTSEDEQELGAKGSSERGESNSHEAEFDLKSADNRTYEDFKSNIEQKEILLAEILDLGCLKMDHESANKGEKKLYDIESRHCMDRELSIESGGCSTPSTVKEQSPVPDGPVYEDFFAQFYSENSFSSFESGPDSSSQKVHESNVENNFDGNSLGSNDGGERIESNTSEDRLSCLSYGPPSGSSLVSLPGNRFHTESQENNTSEPRTMITVTDSSEVADISWSYSTVEFHDNHEYENEEMTGGWVKQRIPSSVFSLSVSENTITFLDDCGCLYFKNVSNDSSSHAWRKVKLTAKVTDISLSPNNSVLWIRSDGHAYAVGSPALEVVSPAKMSLAARNVKQMSLDDELAWYTREGQVCVQLGLSSRSPCGVEYTISCKEFQLVKVVCHARVVWGLTDRGQVAFRIGVSTQSPMGHEWGLMKSQGLKVKDLALGPGNWGWIVDMQGRVYFRAGVCAEYPQGRDSKWWQVATSDYMMEQTSELGSTMLSLSSKGIYLAERGKNYIYTHTTDVQGHVWNVFSKESWSTVCAEGVYMDQGAICCLSPKGQLFIVNPNTSNYVPLDVADTECVVSVAQRPEAIWVLTAAGDIFIRVGLSANSLHGSHWEQLDLHQIGDIHLCHLSCGTEVVWGVDTRGGVYMRQGPLTPPPVESLPPAWIQVDPTPLKGNAVFTKVYVGTKLHMVWGVDSSRRVYVREAIFPELPIGLSWVPVMGLLALHLSISENDVYALTPNGEIFKRIGVTETNYIGDAWEKVPGNLAKISVTTDDRLWGLNSSGYLCQHQMLTVTEMRQKAVSRSRDVSLGSETETEDWEMI